MNKTMRNVTLFGVLILALIVGLIGALMVMVALPASPAHALPPRPSPAQASAPVGGRIILTVSGTTSQMLWAEVEWQDPQGKWHSVDGWKGMFDATQEWWVGEDDLGTGPFRWLVYDGSGGTLLASSEAFDLPDKPKQTVNVEVSLGP